MEIATIICPANRTGLSKLWPDVSMPLFSQLCNQRCTVVFWQVCVINAAEIKPTNSPQLCSEDLVVDKWVKKHRGDGVTACYHTHWSHLFFLKLNPPKLFLCIYISKKYCTNFMSNPSFLFIVLPRTKIFSYGIVAFSLIFSRVLVYNHLQGNMLSHLTMT